MPSFQAFQSLSSSRALCAVRLHHHLGGVLAEQLDDLFALGVVSLEQCEVEGGAVPLVPGVRVGPLFQEELDRSGVAKLACRVKGRAAVLIAGLHVRTGIEEKLDDIGTSGLGRLVQRGPALYVFCVHVGAGFNEGPGNVEMVYGVSPGPQAYQVLR